tara:strand:- start:29 stop:283 length:255 start_codon:yes stop_codon:yes gene_type:complete
VKRDTTIVDSERGVLRCLACGDVFPVPLGDPTFCGKVMVAFSRAHRGCGAPLDHPDWKPPKPDNNRTWAEPAGMRWIMEAALDG